MPIETSEIFAINDFPDLLQASLKLQDFNLQDKNTKNEKELCCAYLECQTFSCKTFWDRFNFEHRCSKELTSLRKEFDLEF